MPVVGIIGGLLAAVLVYLIAYKHRQLLSMGSTAGGNRRQCRAGGGYLTLYGGIIKRPLSLCNSVAFWFDLGNFLAANHQSASLGHRIVCRSFLDRTKV